MTIDGEMNRSKSNSELIYLVLHAILTVRFLMSKSNIIYSWIDFSEIPLNNPCNKYYVFKFEFSKDFQIVVGYKANISVDF
jgi:hypothetical protein